MSTPNSHKTGLNYRRRWGRRLFGRTDSVKIVGYVVILGVDGIFAGRNVHLPRLPVIHDQNLGVGGVDAFSWAVIMYTSVLLWDGQRFFT